MKKTTILAALAVGAMMATSCGQSSPKAEMKNDIDSLSYAFGQSQSQGVKQYLAQMEIDTAYMDEFVKGLTAGATGNDDKRKAAYNAGVTIGMQLGMMQKNASKQLFAGDTTKTMSMKNLLAGFIAGTTGKKKLMTDEQANMLLNTISQRIMKQSTEKQYGPNKKASEAFMAKIAKTPGLKKLPGGTYYKVIKEGTGAIPADTSMVTVNYEGRTVDGKVFDSSYKRKEPMQIRANQVIPGFTQALTHMPVGSAWEVYIPWDQAYGSTQMSEIKPYSALIFKIELVATAKK